MGLDDVLSDLVSIHAPVRVVTRILVADFVFLRVSIHAPVRERQMVNAKVANAKAFQSTLPCGSDRN